MRKLAPAFVMTTFIALASGSALALGDMHKDKKAPKTDTTTSSSTYSSPSTTSSTSTTPDKQVARNDDKCDMSKYPNKADMPKDCKDKSGTGAAATSSTQKQSGGDSGSSSGSAGSSSSSSGSSSK